MRRTTISNGRSGQEERAKIIESFEATGSISKTAQEIGTTCGTVRKWLKRHARDPASGLLDAPRSGRPSKVARLAGDAHAMTFLKQALHDNFSLSSIQKLLIEKMDIWVGRTCLGEFVRASNLVASRPRRHKPNMALKKRKRHKQDSAGGEFPQILPAQIEAEDERYRKRERSRDYESKGKTLNEFLLDVAAEEVQPVPPTVEAENQEEEPLEVLHQNQEKGDTAGSLWDLD